MQLNFSFGNFSFHASSNFTASLLATVNSSSKSSPSVSAAAKAGLADEFFFAASFAARETGTADFKISAPTLARVQDVPQIARQPVAQINHRVN